MRNKRALFLFHGSRGTFHGKIGGPCGFRLRIRGRVPKGRVFPRWAFEGNGIKVRLDDDIQRGAFGLTADKTSKATGRDSRASGTGKRRGRGQDPHVANALRNAYEEAVREDVPQEFIDLLGKLT
jgi:hypothetical protein